MRVRCQLPSFAEPLLLDRLHGEKIVEVHEIRQRTMGDFDYLGLFATFEVNSSFERWYHQRSFFGRDARTPIGHRQSYFALGSG
jgi:hypothetical protein